VNELAAVEIAVTQDEKINDGPKNELKLSIKFEKS
jgi:hypothetical protein